MATAGPRLQDQQSQDHNASIGRNGPARSIARQTRQRITANGDKIKKSIPCKFFLTADGCHAGDLCLFLHPPAITQGQSTPSRARDVMQTQKWDDPTSSTPVPDLEPDNRIRDHGSTEMHAAAAAAGIISAVISKPVPIQQQQDPRQFEITQILRRFSPTCEDDESGTHLVFTLVPSDPDFPFELSGLNCNLTVPKSYPIEGKPVLRVLNPEMERGYQINVERGFDSLAASKPRRTLLSLMNELDKKLEPFLIAEKQKTIKLVLNGPKKEVPAAPIVQEVRLVVTPLAKPEPEYTVKQKSDARIRREADIRQLEARIGRQPLFSKSSDGLSFSIPLQIPKPGRLPPTLQAVKSTKLFVPILYNLQPCTIRLDQSSAESRQVELAFEVHARQNPDLSLMAHINHLAQNFHLMAQLEAPIAVDNVSPPSTKAQDQLAVIDKPEPVPDPAIDDERPHLKFMPRPPEWDNANNEPEDDQSSEEYGSEEEYSSDEEDERDEGGAPVPVMTSTNQAETGVLLSFPSLELYGIELLEISSISLTVKCDRCKDIIDIKNIRPTLSSNPHPIKTESCKKCTTLLSVAYRKEPMHTNSIRAGYLDIEGCSILDLLPSTFIPTCSECSTVAATGIVSVRGESSLSICRECHKRMTFKLPEVKFLRVSSTSNPNRPLPLKKPKDKVPLGITAGQPLPNKGRCKHYAKSYRWFRFSCCAKVYACDKCHDEKEQHPNEHANRMICGLCSREQNYRPEDCGLCRSGLVGKKSGGFWEGGRGTRDKVKMSRKDPRKYKRRAGG